MTSTDKAPTTKVAVGGAAVDGIPGGETYYKLGVAIEGGAL